MGFKNKKPAQAKAAATPAKGGKVGKKNAHKPFKVEAAQVIDAVKSNLVQTKTPKKQKNGPGGGRPKTPKPKGSAPKQTPEASPEEQPTKKKLKMFAGVSTVKENEPLTEEARSAMKAKRAEKRRLKRMKMAALLRKEEPLSVEAREKILQRIEEIEKRDTLTYSAKRRLGRLKVLAGLKEKKVGQAVSVSEKKGKKKNEKKQELKVEKAVNSTDDDENEVEEDADDGEENDSEDGALEIDMGEEEDEESDDEENTGVADEDDDDDDDEDEDDDSEEEEEEEDVAPKKTAVKQSPKNSPKTNSQKPFANKKGGSPFAGKQSTPNPFGGKGKKHQGKNKRN